MTPVPVTLGYLKNEDLNVEAVVAKAVEGEDALEFQRALEFDEDDVARGWDTYCLVMAGWTTYGGLDSISADTADGVQVLTVTLAAGAAAELGLEPVIELAVDPEELRAVLPDLLRILELGQPAD